MLQPVPASIGWYAPAGQFFTRDESVHLPVSYLKAAIVAAFLLLAFTAVSVEAAPPFNVAAAPPSNDSFATATIVPPALPYTNSQSALEATLEAGEPQPCGIFAATVWYTFVPAASGVVKVTTAGADYDTGLAIYTRNSLPS